MIYVLSGGQTGATLTVTSSGAGTITVSNTSLGKSYSKSVTAGGSAVFKGLATGTWTVKLSNGTQTSTKTITITSDYSTSIAYFSATISITYPANSTCVVKNSGGQTVASDTNTGSSTKTWTATVNATGTYTVTATATDGSGKSKSQSVSITTEGQSESVMLSYELILYDNGTFNKDATGDWIDTITYGENSGGITENSSYMSFAGGYHTHRVFSHKTPIDITSYNSLNVTFQVTGTSGDKCDFGVGTSNNNEIFSASVTNLDSGNKITKNLSISEVNGNNYFKFLVRSEMTVKFYKAWLT